MLRALRPVLLLAALAAPVPASAEPDYAPPAAPVQERGEPTSRSDVRRVCGQRESPGCFATIQAAVNAARAGDTVLVPDGTYSETVRIAGAARRHLRLVGDRRSPSRVVLRGTGERHAGVVVRGADGVTVEGFALRGHRLSGVRVRDVTGYRLRRIVVSRAGGDGIRVSGSVGGIIAGVTVGTARGSGVRIDATPARTRPRRTMIRGLIASGSFAGLSGAGARHVTVTRSQLSGNAIGVALLAPESVVVIDNEISGNRRFGYWLLGDPVGSRVTGNAFVLNDVDIAYDGSGSGNCAESNTGVRRTIPADGSTLAPCPFSGANAFSEAARAEMTAPAARSDA